MIEDITIFLNEKILVHTNQWIIGLDALFKGYIVWNWFEIDLNNEFEDVNKILVKYCIQFYH